MRIPVKDLTSVPLPIKGALDPKDFHFKEENIACVGPVAVSGTAEKNLDLVSVEAEVKARFSFICARCAEPFEKEIARDLTLHYTLEPSSTHVELGEDIRQEIFLEFNMRNLCQENCRGVCPRCGANLNTEKCRCPIDR